MERFNPRARTNAETRVLIGAASGLAVGTVALKLICRHDNCSEAEGIVVLPIGGVILGGAHWAGDFRRERVDTHGVGRSGIWVSRCRRRGSDEARLQIGLIGLLRAGAGGSNWPRGSGSPLGHGLSAISVYLTNREAKMKRLLAVALALGCWSSQSQAQLPDSAGTLRLRLWLRDEGRLDGRLIRRDTSWLIVRPDGSTGHRSVHREEILRMERFGPNIGRDPGTGAVIGAAVGVGAGLVVIKLLCAGQDCSEAEGLGVMPLAGAILGGLLGLAASSGGDDWTPVTCGDLATRSIGVGLSLPTRLVFR